MALLVFCTALSRAGAATLTIDLNASPRRAAPDGASTVTLTATVRSGVSLAGDGIPVQFTASVPNLLPYGTVGASSLNLTVNTNGGMARCQLRATLYETSVAITAEIMNPVAVAQCEVSFGSGPAANESVDNIVRVSGTYIDYYPEAAFQVMEVVGDGVVTYQGVEIHAPRIEIDLQDYLLIARNSMPDDVTIARGPPPYPQKKSDPDGPPWVGDELAVDLRSFAGAIFRTRTAQTTQFGTRSLRRAKPKELPPGTFDMPLEGLDKAKIYVRCKHALIYPNQKIRFDRPNFYVNDQKVMSLPYYFESLGGGSSNAPSLSQMVSYSSQDGLIVDIPYYFDVTDRETNELRLSRGTQEGVYGRSTGFQVLYSHHADLKQDKGTYDFTLDELGLKTGVEYDRTQRFDPNNSMNLSIAWPEHSNFYSTLNINSRVGPGTLNTMANVNAQQGAGGGPSGNANLVWQSNPWAIRALGSNVSLAVGGGYNYALGGLSTVQETASLSLDHKPWKPIKGATVTPSAGLRYENSGGAGNETAFEFNANWRQDLNKAMSVSMGYTFDKTWNSRLKVPDSHLFNFNWTLQGNARWRGYLFGNYELLSRSLTASALLDYLFTTHWGVQAQSVYQSSPASSYRESELWLYRLIGSRELRLRYTLEERRVYVEVDNQF